MIKISSGVKFVFVITFGLIITFFLSFNFDVTCGIDQCRYVNINDAILFRTLSEKYTATLFIFNFYSLAQGNDFNYILAFLLNVGVVLFLCVFCDIKYISKYYLTPFIIPFFFLPGKEFFIILGGALIFYPYINKVYPSYKKIGSLFFGIVLILVSRPPFLILLISISFFCYYFFKFKYSKRVLFILLTFFSLAVFMSLFKGIYVEPASLYTESSIPYATKIRVLTSGYGIIESVLRLFIYFIYGVLSPFIELIRLINLKEINPSLLLSLSSIMVCYFYIKNFGVKLYIVAILIASIFIAPIFSFIHTRYMITILCFIYFCFEYNLRNKK